jgi:hypothetical protein
LTDDMPGGLRWSQPASGVVFVATTGEVIHVDRGTIGESVGVVDTGVPWSSMTGDE